MGRRKSEIKAVPISSEPVEQDTPAVQARTFFLPRKIMLLNGWKALSSDYSEMLFSGPKLEPVIGDILSVIDDFTPPINLRITEMSKREDGILLTCSKVE